MKLIFAKNIGFCSGVKRAIEISEKSLKEDPKPVQFLGPLVHNEKVIERLKKSGGKFIPPSRLESGIKSGTLILRAHGEILNLKKIRKNVLIKVRDATCPLVKRAQKAAQNLSRAGYKVIIIGDRGHPEVKGIRRYIKGKAIVVEDKLEAKKLKKFKRLGVVAQTTQDSNKVKMILGVLKQKSKELKWLNTLCPEVSNRQKELRAILKKVDGTLVIGSKSSANTLRLLKIAQHSKKPVWLVNSLGEFKKINFKDLSTLMVTSGTSAPDWEIKKIKEWLEEKVK